MKRGIDCEVTDLNGHDLTPPTKRHKEVTITTMKLYTDNERIWNELRVCGYSKDTEDIIDVSILNKFDCYNYGGADAAKRMGDMLQVNSSSMLLDVGSGLGGPARCAGHHTGCGVLGVELQPDLVMLSNELTRRCGLSNRIRFIEGDFTDSKVDVGNNDTYDAAMSWLVILHIPLTLHSMLFKRVYNLLKPGGKMYIEDFYSIQSGDHNEFTDGEVNMLIEDVYIPDGCLSSQADYVNTLQAAGFMVSFEDATQEWTNFTSSRVQKWRNERQRRIDVHNEVTFKALEHFYHSIEKLFLGRHLGGAKIVITKPE